MCRPSHFAVTYSINPWMRPEEPADIAVAQWRKLLHTLRDPGHAVTRIDPHRGLRCGRTRSSPMRMTPRFLAST
jgi:N-dimethylarginine dimethylaminohydrolase